MPPVRTVFFSWATRSSMLIFIHASSSRFSSAAGFFSASAGFSATASSSSSSAMGPSPPVMPRAPKKSSSVASPPSSLTSLGSNWRPMPPVRTVFFSWATRSSMLIFIHASSTGLPSAALAAVGAEPVRACSSFTRAAIGSAGRSAATVLSAALRVCETLCRSK